MGRRDLTRILSKSVGLAVALALVIAGVAGMGLWPGRGTVEAAIRFEVRLAEDQPAPGLFAARVAGSEQIVFLHPETVVTNDDIVRSAVVAGDVSSRFNISVQFDADGAQKMQQATANHIGRPVAILIDGDVVMAPVLRSPIGASAMITGNYARSEAQRIVDGIGVR
jgi:hypothetical protein